MASNDPLPAIIDRLKEKAKKPKPKPSKKIRPSTKKVKHATGRSTTNKSYLKSIHSRSRMAKKEVSKWLH